MADEIPDAAAPAAPAAGAAVQPKLMLHSQFLQDLSFENPQGAKSFSRADIKPQVQVNLNVDSRKLGETLHEVSLKITANATHENEACFLVELDYRGVFSLTGADETVLSQVLLIEGPRNIFPFARRIIADTVRDGGFPPLMLEPVDFVTLYRSHARRTPAEGGAEAVPAT
ncbi:MAG: protein-export chaperone SecB [Rhodospirillales bacterium]|nr:protein-export chaperone SecB [Rhodospirillales bacterium]